MILYGPPGSGKTTLARIVAAQTRAAFEEASAVEAGAANVTSRASGAAPDAARSLRLTAAARKPSSRQVSQSRRK